MHKRLLLPLLLGPLLISAGPSSAEPRLQSRVESFDVSGATVDTIRECRVTATFDKAAVARVEAGQRFFCV